MGAMEDYFEYHMDWTFLFETWHDEVKGAKRGPNTIHILEAEGIRIAHLGDLGCELEEDQIQKLKGLDLCLIPVGGHFTIDGKQAA
jgi:L-ascorbate metabolism protein UlaG (beta-lactamase superfamily)